MEYRNELGQIVGRPLPDWQPCPRPAGELLTGRFCRLERLKVEIHAEALHQASQLDQHGAHWTYLPYGPFHSLEEYRGWLQNFALGDDPLFYAIVAANSGSAVGVASYMRIVPEDGVVEVGHVSFSPLLQRTAAATEAMYLMMKHAFSLGYRRYEWKCDALNQGSWEAAERLGFRFEGVFRQAAVRKGRNRDTAWFSIIDSEWPLVGTALERWLEPGNFDEQGRQLRSLRAIRQDLLQARQVSAS